MKKIQADELTRTVIIHLTGTVYKKFRAEAELNGMTLQEGIERLIIDRLQEIEDEKDEWERECADD